MLCFLKLATQEPTDPHITMFCLMTLVSRLMNCRNLFILYHTCKYSFQYQRFLSAWLLVLSLQLNYSHVKWQQVSAKHHCHISWYVLTLPITISLPKFILQSFLISGQVSGLGLINPDSTRFSNTRFYLSNIKPFSYHLLLYTMHIGCSSDGSDHEICGFFEP